MHFCNPFQKIAYLFIIFPKKFQWIWISIKQIFALFQFDELGIVFLPSNVGLLKFKYTVQVLESCLSNQVFNYRLFGLLCLVSSKTCTLCIILNDS